jgi:Ca2+-binding RTX toxin-like protein
MLVKSWLRWFKSSLNAAAWQRRHSPPRRTRRSRHHSNGQVANFALEQLEDRTLLTYLFVDFGDNFPAGTLTTTQGAFRDVANDATPANRILGTTLLDSDNEFAAGTQLDIVAQTFTANERAQMLAVIERAYAPLDITVVELTGAAQMTADGRNVAGATAMADVINTLRGGNAAFRDAYIFVATFIVDVGGPDQQTYTGSSGTSPSGGATGTTLDTTDLNAASNVHDDVAVVFSSGGFSFNTMNNISHEAGHLFGLRHGITDATGTAATNLFHQAEIMSYRNTNNTTSSMFTRFPMIRGDGNSPGFDGTATFNAAARTITRPMGADDFDDEGFVAGLSIVVTGTGSNNGTYVIQSVSAATLTLVAGSVLTDEMSPAATAIRSLNTVNYNDLSARTGDQTIYDQMQTDGNIGSNPNFTFVSGTGAHDIITITRNGAMADVTVQAFADAAYTMGIPVPLVGGTTYSYSIPLNRSILIYGGDSNDRFVIDASLGVEVMIDGMLGTDRLVVNGGGAASATYTPNATAPNGVDILGGVFVRSFGGEIVIGATTISFENFEVGGQVDVNNVATFAVMGSTGVDNLTLANSAGAARVTGTVNGGTGIVPLNLTTITTLNFNTVGSGDQVTVSLNGGNPIPTGGVGVDGGAGTDTLIIQGATATYTPDAAMPNDPSRGRLTVSGSSVNFLNMEFVTPVAPVITNLTLTETNIDENDAITLSGTFTDPGSLSSHTLTIDWGDGTPSQMYPLAVGARSFSIPYQYLDDNPTNTPIDINTITLTITDNDVLTDMDTTQITVNNLEPVILDFASDATLENKAEEGEPVNIMGNFTDVGTLDTHTAVVDWGDGSPLQMVTIVEAGGVGTISGSHIYQFGGIFTITVTLTDDDTGTAMTTTTAVVTGIGINNGVMQIVGSNDNDQVAIYREWNGNYLIVADFLNTVGTYRRFNAADFTSIEATLCVGNDLMTMTPNIAVPLWVDAGEGNDQIYAGGALSLTALGGNGNDTIFGTRGNDVIDGGDGNDTIDGGDGNDILLGGEGNDLISSGFGNDVLVGGGGNDRLSASYGNNLLIGGDGVDLLISGSGANMLIGGSTIHDANNVALRQIADVWASADTYAVRTNRIRNGIGVPQLNAAAVIDDGDADMLTGGFGSDWYFSGASDSLIGRLMTESID